MRLTSEHGLVIAIEAPGRNAARTVVSYIDYDEIGTLLRALDTLQKADNSVSRMANYEAHYRSRGDLELTNLNVNGARMIELKSTQLLIPSGQLISATVRLRVAVLAEIRQQIVAGKQTLDNRGQAEK